ncbi:MAG: Spy/CpxP family protein refolding chaperone [Deltaproteobacteria bacterium]|nr:Spy/CpxP family protein refolding chaperone [Deltaproteobacteria bacterium]
MRSRTVVVAAVVLAIVFAVSSMAIARGQGRSCGGYCDGQGFAGPGSGGPGLGVIMGLKLSDSQRDQALKITETYQIDRIKTRGDVIKESDNLRKALQTDKVNEQDVRKTYKKLSLIREDMLIARAKMMTEMKAILTPEQVKLWDERKAERSDRGRGYADSKGPRSGKWSGDCPRR